MENQGPIRRSLKEKFRAHWNTRDEIMDPKPERANRLGKAFSWIYSSVGTLTLSLYVLPELALSQAIWIQAVTWYLLAVGLWNWALCCSESCQATEANVPQPVLDMAGSRPLPDGWSYCAACQLDAPPRSRHCKVCRMCVLRRGHHCFFTGTCVGWNNQRRFVVFLLYCLLASLNSVWLLSSYLSALADAGWSGWRCSWLPGVPFFLWIWGSMPFWHCYLLLLLHASCVVSILSGCYFIWELGMVLRGQTSDEAAVGIGKYRCTLLDGFRSTFGNYGVLHFLLPLSLPQPGDGVNWPIYKSHKTQ